MFWIVVIVLCAIIATSPNSLLRKIVIYDNTKFCQRDKKTKFGNPSWQ